MKRLVDASEVRACLLGLGLGEGDLVLVRGALGAVGRIAGGAKTIIDVLLDVVGPRGTLVSLAFSETTFIRRPDITKPYTLESATYAGALPKAMLGDARARRSRHPNCSFVAIGAQADAIVANHGPHDRAYEPVRKMTEMKGKGLLIGCVESSPGFTTAHLAEADLGLHRRVILPRLNSVYYQDEEGKIERFYRRDHGLCSQGFSHFYEHYVKSGILVSAHIGEAYCIQVPLAEAYAIERRLLAANPKFAICDSRDCATCNARRWDRLHRLPGFLVRRVMSRMAKPSAQ